jgi:hypothetical protein
MVRSRYCRADKAITIAAMRSCWKRISIDFGRKYHGVANTTSGGRQGSAQLTGGRSGSAYPGNRTKAANATDKRT